MGSTTNFPDLPAMATSPKFIFFTDFDGTITSRDSNDYMTDNLGFGRAPRLALNKQVLANTIAFRDAFKAMLDSIPTPFDKCTEILLEQIDLDSGFRAFYDWARANNVPIVILSGGMTPLIRALLDKLMGEDSSWMQIVSNEVGARSGKHINEEKGWEIVFRDET
jgi:2,3-diketo-5-methylthio-1-phosphopentane phosphatase